MDKFGGVTQFADALGRMPTIDRNENSDPTQVVAPNGAITEATYDTLGNLLTRREAVGTALERLTSFGYEPNFNRLDQITDAAGKVTTLSHDPKGNVLTITDALIGMQNFTYDSRGLVLTQSDENGSVTTFTYDANGNRATVTDDEGDVTQLARDAAGNVTVMTQGLGSPEQRASSLTHDARNRPLSFTDGAGAVTRFTYDAAGNITEIENATGEVQLRAYDERDRVTQIDDPIKGLTQLTYDANDNTLTQVDGLGNLTTFDYDPANRLTTTVDAQLGESIRAYDVENNLVSLQDQRNQTTTFTYDLLNRRITRSAPLVPTATIVYDSRDNLVSMTDPKGQVISNIYDDLSRLTLVSTPDNVIDFTYDAAGNTLGVVDGDSDLAFTFDGVNRVVTADTLVGGAQPLVTLTSTYDAVSNRIQLLDSEGGTTTLAYDDAGRLTQVITPATDIIDLGYDAAGRPTSIDFPNTVGMTAQYDIDGRLASLVHGIGAADLARFTYGYDAVTNVTSIAELTQTLSFDYDALQQVVSGGTVAIPESYAYDAVGNRTVTHLSASHLHDAANRLLDDDSFTYTYDDNGNLETKTNIISSDVTTYTYDAQNQLVRIDFPNLTFVAYRYDGLGRRIEKDVNGTITRYVYDSDDILFEFDGANTLVARYSHGQGIDQPLAQERGGQSFFYHADDLGSIRLVTDAGGVVVNEYDYDSYGNFETIIEGVTNPFTYTGREFDAESGLYYYRARYYDPQTGRFVSQDPIGFPAGDANLYRYVFNNPVNFTDPEGESALTITAPFAAGAAAADGPLPIGDAVALTILAGAAIYDLAVIIDEAIDDETPGEDEEEEPSVPVPDSACGPDDDDDANECLENYFNVDIPICNAISRRRGRDAAQRCFASAAERLAACNRGRPLPPLDTLNI